MATQQTLTTTTEAVLDELGVNVVSYGREIKAFCPVHHLTIGREDRNPSWYMNSTTGAWNCFSCHAAGSLPMLVDMLGGDVDGINDLILANSDTVIQRAAARRDEDSEYVEPNKPVEYVSAYAFSQNPYPPRRMMEDRDIDLATCEALNIRWDKEGRCFLLPVYSFDGALMGWQEKATGYFNNYPKGLGKKGSLFGYQMLNSKSKPVIVESPLDAARFHRYGYKAVAIYGSYMSGEQADAITNLYGDAGARGSYVILAFDNDQAGHDASMNAARMFRDRGVGVRYFNYGEGYQDADPGDLTAYDLKEGVDNPLPTMPVSVLEARERAAAKRKSR